VTGLEKLRAICGVYYLMGGGVQPVAIGKLKEIANQIERETLPRPTDVDGNVLNIGNRVHMLRDEYNGTDEWDDVVVGLRYDENPGDPWTVCGWQGEAFACNCATMPTDTWERIAADVDSGKGYAGMDAAEVAADVLRRCKALAGVE
jgi:hypothetical protein